MVISKKEFNTCLSKETKINTTGTDGLVEVGASIEDLPMQHFISK